jgi:hypothetical protein
LEDNGQIPEFISPEEKRFIKDLNDYGEYKDFVGGDREDNLKMHPYTHHDAGFVMADEDKIIPASIREMSRKVLGSLMKG